MLTTKSGFTIVELLIVILVIAILTAITVVVYSGMQNQTRATTIKSDLVNVKKKILLYGVEQSQYPSSVANLTTANVSASEVAYDTTGNNFYYCKNSSTNEFALGARTISNTAAFIITSTTGLQSVSGVGADQVCQAVGLTGWADANAYISNGYSTSTGWASWVR